MKAIKIPDTITLKHWHCIQAQNHKNTEYRIRIAGEEVCNVTANGLWINYKDFKQEFITENRFAEFFGLIKKCQSLLRKIGAHQQLTTKS